MHFQQDQETPNYPSWRIFYCVWLYIIFGFQQQIARACCDLVISDYIPTISC